MHNRGSLKAAHCSQRAQRPYEQRGTAVATYSSTACAHPAAGVAAQTEPVAPGGRALVPRSAAHDAQALLAAPEQREHARDRDELLEGAIKTPEALATAVTQRARHNRRHAARDRTQLIPEHRMISRRANHTQPRVVARLDQPRQIDRPPQHRQLIITRRRNAERNDRGQAQHSPPVAPSRTASRRPDWRT